MKKLVILIALAGLLPATILAQGGLRYTIQVTKFENQAGWHGRWDLGDGWGAVLTDKLNQTNKFIVVAEQDMRNAAMDEQDLASSGRVAGGKKAPKTGQMTPAQLLVKGVITAFDDGTSGGSTGGSFKGVRVRVKGGKSLISGTVYVVDATTATVTASTDFTAEVKIKGVKLGLSRHGFHGDVGGFKKTPAGQVMAAACEDVADFLMAQADTVPWSGTVIKGGSDRIIINRGSREGVSEGQVFRIGKSEEIRDPDTGELLDHDFMETGTVRITKVKEKLAYCELVSGNPPQKGDSIYQ